MGYADLQVGIGYGYVTNRMGIHLEGDQVPGIVRQWMTG
jgi:hypothetical protein